MVPTFIKEVRVSAKIESTAGHKFRGFGVSEFTGFQKFNSDITIWDEKTKEERIAVRGWSGKSLGSEISAAEAKKMCHVVEWMPDLNLVKQPKLQAVLASDQENEEYRQKIRRLQLASVLFVTLALEDLKDYPVKNYEGHFKNYYEWGVKVRDDLHNNLLPHLDFNEWKQYMENEPLREKLFEDILDSADGRLLVRMGRNLAPVMKKEVDPLQLMFGQDDILDELYRNMVESGDLPGLLAAYLKLSTITTSISILWKLELEPVHFLLQCWRLWDRPLPTKKDCLMTQLSRSILTLTYHQPSLRRLRTSSRDGEISWNFEHSTSNLMLLNKDLSKAHTITSLPEMSSMLLPISRKSYQTYGHY
jgi:hypothetical protein